MLTENKKYTNGMSIGGYLYVVAVCKVIGLIGTAFTAVSGLYMLSSLITLPFAIAILTCVGVYWFDCYNFFAKKHKYVTFNKWYYIINILAAFVSGVVSFMILIDLGETHSAAQTIGQSIGQIFAFIILWLVWSIYLRKSQRVKCTFVN